MRYFGERSCLLCPVAFPMPLDPFRTVVCCFLLPSCNQGAVFSPYIPNRSQSVLALSCCLTSPRFSGCIQPNSNSCFFSLQLSNRLAGCIQLLVSFQRRHAAASLSALLAIVGGRITSLFFSTLRAGCIQPLVIFQQTTASEWNSYCSVFAIGANFRLYSAEFLVFRNLQAVFSLYQQAAFSSLCPGRLQIFHTFGSNTILQSTIDSNLI